MTPEPFDIDHAAKRLAEVIPRTNPRSFLIAQPVRRIGFASGAGCDIIVAAIGNELGLTDRNIDAVVDDLALKYAGILGYPPEGIDPREVGLGGPD